MKTWMAACAVLMVAVGVSAAQGEGPVAAEKQVVVETSAGAMVFELYPEEAPNHVKAFQERIRSNAYVGTVFHRVVPYGIIQGGDPLSKDPSKWEQYGTGGLFELETEPSKVSHIRGTLSAVMVPGSNDSPGAQFFVCVTDQLQLDGQFTAYGRIVDGIDVAEKISQLPTDDQQRVKERLEITATYERDPPPPEVIPFLNTSAQELVRYHAVIKTNLGEIELAFFPDLAPEHVRQFLRFAQLGLYDGTTFHRVVEGFVIQGGSLASRKQPVPEKYRPWVKMLKAEFSDRQHVKGILSMARGEEVDSGLDSFFIVLGPQPGLDGEYTVFGEVVSGLDTVEGIAGVPVQGESPLMPVTIEAIEVIEVPAAE